MSRQQVQPFSVRPQELPVKADLARLRVAYGKSDRLAYLGHLDLIATIERCVRRARLPFSIGNGFARRMRIQFSSALPTGTSSSCEYFDVRLVEAIDPEEALALLRAATPEALAPVRAAYVPGRLPALEAWLNRVSWEVSCLGAPFSPDELARAVSAVRERGQITYLRGEKEKRIDVGETLVSFSAHKAADGVELRLETRSSGAAALRPQVLLDAALGGSGLALPRSVRVRRCAQRHEENGRLVEPFGPFDLTGDTPVS